MFSRSFKRVGLHYTAFRNAIREDSRQTAPSRGVSPRKKFTAQANVESRVKAKKGEYGLQLKATDGERTVYSDIVDCLVEGWGMSITIR